MTTQNQTITKIAIFQKKEVRKTLHNNEWWFVVEDVVAILTDSVQPKGYIKDMRRRDKELSEGWGQIATPLSIDTAGGSQKLNCANTEGIFRIIQSISSPKAEPFKRWLARVGYERIEEIENPKIEKKIKQTLITKINKALWWHVTPSDPDAYKKRGKFLASTFNQAAFYGRPNDEPEKVKISNPLWGISELDILKILFPSKYKELYKSVTNIDEAEVEWYQRRSNLDAKMYHSAKKMGYDAIVLLTKSAIKDLEANRKPRSIELNLCF